MIILAGGGEIKVFNNTRARLANIERQYGVVLPQVYKDFFRECATALPKHLVGSDLAGGGLDLREAAIELLEEDGAENFLEHDDFVFMMHQGYMFFYFKADGELDPVVYGYREGKLKPDRFERFSEYIKAYY